MKSQPQNTARITVAVLLFFIIGLIAAGCATKPLTPQNENRPPTNTEANTQIPGLPPEISEKVAGAKDNADIHEIVDEQKAELKEAKADFDQSLKQLNELNQKLGKMAPDKQLEKYTDLENKHDELDQAAKKIEVITNTFDALKKSSPPQASRCKLINPLDLFYQCPPGEKIAMRFEPPGKNLFVSYSIDNKASKSAPANTFDFAVANTIGGKTSVSVTYHYGTPPNQSYKYWFSDTAAEFDVYDKVNGWSQSYRTVTYTFFAQ